MSQLRKLLTFRGPDHVSSVILSFVLYLGQPQIKNRFCIQFRGQLALEPKTSV